MKEGKQDVIVVDAGNTRIKVALFSDGQITEIKRFTLQESHEFNRFVTSHPFSAIFVSSVLKEADLQSFLGPRDNVDYFTHQSRLPLGIKYETPETLGLDRLANAAAVQFLQPAGHKVAIDMGTCIKFDFVDAEGNYQGGSISPGLHMRYAALAHYTGKLPFLSFEEQKAYVGKSSRSSIHAGVIHGIQGELDYFISRYLQDYQGLTFFVTGGDAKFFEFPSKNNIFADENLTLTGLYKIYLLNA